MKEYVISIQWMSAVSSG